MLHHWRHATSFVRWFRQWNPSTLRRVVWNQTCHAPLAAFTKWRRMRQALSMTR
jgi:hypothetical protein